MSVIASVAWQSHRSAFMMGLLRLWLAMTIFGSATYSEQQFISKATSQFLAATPKQNILDVDKYLQNFISRKKDNNIIEKAQSFLKSQYFISTATCSFLEENSLTNLICKILPKKTIKEITVKNLPAILLLSDLRKKLPIATGQVIPEEINELEKIKNNIINFTDKFLISNGFYHANIDVNFIDLKNVYSSDVIIDIKGGSFAYVNKVEVIGDAPINKKLIARAYKTMCLSPTRLINAIGLGSFSCYSKPLEDETTKNLEEKFAKLGFIETRLRINSQWIKVKSGPPRINLRIEVQKGPKVTLIFRMLDNHYVERNKLSELLGQVFFVDNLNRVTAGKNSNQKITDNMIIKRELKNQVTLMQAKSIDENELKNSQEALQNLLIEKGYLYAKVDYFINKNKIDDIKVIFLITTGKRYIVEQVLLNPNSYYKFINKDTLNDIIPTRSWLNNGRLAPNSVDIAKKYITQALKSHGFIDISVNAELETKDQGEVTIQFNIATNGRNTLSDISIINGIEELNNQILPNLANKGSLIKEEIDNDKIKIIDYYKNQGYLYIDAQSELLEDQNGYHLNFHLFDKRYGIKNTKELKKQNIKEIIISGNNNTSEQAIKRLFNTSSPKELKKGIGFLREAGIFSKIDNKILASFHNSDDVYFLINIVEKPTLFLSSSLAFSTDKLFSIEGRLEENNLFSSMLKLDTSLSLGLFWGRESSFQNKIIWPKILGSNFKLTIDAPSLVYKDKSNAKEPEREFKGTIGATLQMPHFLGLRPYVGYDFTLSQTQKNARRQTFQNSLKTLDGLLDVWKITPELDGIFSVGLDFTSLDNPFEPRLGVNLSGQLEFGGGIFYGTVPFTIISTTNSFFWPMGPFVWALKLDFARGFITPSGKNWGRISKSKSLGKLGGDQSIRGYWEDNIGITEFSGQTQSGAGYFFNNAKVELRFPLNFSKEESNFKGALFVDEGMVIPCQGFFNCLSEKQNILSVKNKNGIGLSAGAALRYSLPVGVISLEYGFSLIHDNKQRFHLLLGYVI